MARMTPVTISGMPMLLNIFVSNTPSARTTTTAIIGERLEPAAVLHWSVRLTHFPTHERTPQAETSAPWKLNALAF
jgi:hypothetical protein